MSGGKTAATVLRDAVEVLRENGWIQDEYFASDDPKSGCCAMGAISVAAKRTRLGGYSVACEALSREIHLNNIAIWNDAPGRTQADVEDALLAAAARLDAGSGEQQ